MADLKIVVTDTLKVEKMDMAVVDLSYRYLYRIVEPIPMHWQVAQPISTALTLFSEHQRSAQDLMVKSMLNEWLKIVEESSHLAEWNESLNWMKEIRNVIVIDCQPQPTGQSINIQGITYGNQR